LLFIFTAFLSFNVVNDGLVVHSMKGLGKNVRIIKVDIKRSPKLSSSTDDDGNDDDDDDDNGNYYRVYNDGKYRTEI